MKSVPSSKLYFSHTLSIKHFRPGVTVQDLAALKPAFKKEGGTVTAGNASGINDGAATVVVMSERKAKELGVIPMAVFTGGASAGVDPAVMGIGPAFSTRKLLGLTGMPILRGGSLFLSMLCVVPAGVYLTDVAPELPSRRRRS